ncbi:hypothetical protein EMCRGX_G018222 [Ephydatia muelleri]
MVQGWDRGSPAALDITVTSPLTPATLRDASSTAGAAAYAAECRKHTANDVKCQELGWACIPLAVETFGNWGMEAQGVFSRLASALGMHQGTSKSWALHTIYSRLNMSLVRSVARSILGYVPWNTGGSEKDIPQYGNSLHIAGCDDPIGN